MDGYDRQVRYARLLGLVFVAVGFVAIGLAWNGSARVACVDCQFPYLLSGGATGLGLILFGSALLVMSQLRSERLKLGAQLEELGHSLSRVAASADGQTASAGAGQVLAGRSTYHRPGCRLVEGKDLDAVTVEAAVESGLSACRVCAPEAPGSE
ncbi:MAG: hypothetical protein ACRDHK_14665, partial [Actinomycetota bacterium]